MKKLTWFHHLGFYTNPFSIKPAMYDNELLGYGKIIDKVNDNIAEGKLSLVVGPYGTGKTTILKGVIAKFGGRKAVIYYNCVQKDGDIDYDTLLRKSGGFFSRLFRIKSKNRILLLDEAQEMSEDDQKSVLDHYGDKFFRAIVLVSKKEDISLIKEVKDAIKDSTFELGKLSESEAIELVRRRIGSLDFLPDDIIAKIFRENTNPRAFLKNCEEACRIAFEDEAKGVKEKHLKSL
ncbi:TPA: AAA family ATPase [Candidatus Woesearchaeota archaeon]|nr:AAA family ATPase [Candidatus Woesearchaeota archaeon]